MNKEDKEDFFARINENICNALSQKECEKCSFYMPKDKVKGYEEILKKGKRDLLKNKNK